MLSSFVEVALGWRFQEDLDRRDSIDIVVRSGGAGNGDMFWEDGGRSTLMGFVLMS